MIAKPNEAEAIVSAKSRMAGIDIIKGLLITLVIYGHTMENPVIKNTLIRGIIYSFHMPAFFFIAGFLLSPTQFYLRSWVEQIYKYRKTFFAWLAVSLLFISLPH